MKQHVNTVEIIAIVVAAQHIVQNAKAAFISIQLHVSLVFSQIA